MSFIKVLVIGGSGFLGQELVKSLALAGIPFSYTYKNFSRSTDVVFIEHSFCLDLQSSSFEFLDRGEYTHVVCLIPIANSLPLIKRTPSYKSIQFIFISTTAIYTEYASSYRLDRLNAESLLVRNCPSCIIIRPTMITGSLNYDTVGRLIHVFSSRGYGILPRPIFGSCIFQPIDVYDLSQLIVSFILNKLPLGSLPYVCDVGGHAPVGFFKYFRCASEFFGFKLFLVPVPFCLLLPLLKFLGFCGFEKFLDLYEKLYRLQEVKVVSNRLHPLIRYEPSSYFSSLACLRNKYLIDRFNS